MVKLFGIQINTINGTQGYPFTGSAQEEVLGDAVKSSVDGNPEKEERPAVPCPRCNSPNTKFCYFNNYNVNQPRHFCKSCQRYWTAGGALRNVPEGSGCRKKTKRTPFEISKTARSAEFLRSSSADVAPPNNQSLSTHSIRLPSPSPGEALPKVSNERLGSPEPYIEVIKPSPFHFPVGPCSNIGYGFKGVGLSHETRLWTTPPCSPIAKVALLGKHPRERLEIVETDGSTLIANTSRIRKLQEDNRPVQSSISSMTLGSEENRTNSLVSTAGTGGIFNGFPLTFEEPPIQALNDNPAAMNRLVSFQEGQPWNGILERKRSGMPQTSLEVSRKLMNL